MDSDSDNFESADENLSSDEEDSNEEPVERVKNIENNKNIKKDERLTDIKKSSREEKKLSEDKKSTIVERIEEKTKDESFKIEKHDAKEPKISCPKEKVEINLNLEEDRAVLDPKHHAKDPKIDSPEETVDSNLSSEADRPVLDPKNHENDVPKRAPIDNSVVEAFKNVQIDPKVEEKQVQDEQTHEKVLRQTSTEEKLTSIEEPSFEIVDKPVKSVESSEKVSKKPQERKERPTKMKSKLGVKLGTKIDKKPTFDDPPPKPVIKQDPEPCWEDETGWDAFDTTPEKYSLQKSEKETENFWNDEEQYMELRPKRENFQNIADKMSAGDRQQSSSWGAWGNWGVSSILSTASLGVSTLTNSVSQGITTVLETGIGIPDPEELARQDRLEKQKRNSVPTSDNCQPKVTEEEQNIPRNSENRSSAMNLGIGLGNFVSGVSHITKLVESTGTKVLSGGLDTLETIGKKTMEVLQEGDPGFKKKKKFLGLESEKPVLSHVLREAKEKAEEENKFLQERHYETKAHYETLFDDHQGLVHLEALEMLSKQCDIKLENILESKVGNEFTEFQETLSQIKELCEIPEDDEDPETNIETISEKLSTAISELNVNITYDHLISTWNGIDDWLLDISLSERELHQKSIEVLAKLTAISVEQFHKAGELLLVKERRSTVDEADSLVQLTTTLTSLIGMTANKFSERLNALAEFSSDPNSVNNLITNIFLEAANSSSYIQDAFHLLIPVLQVGAV